MSRRIIMPVYEIYRRRGYSWAQHYQNRATVRALCSSGWDGVQVTRALSQDYPTPELQIDGSLLDVPLNVRREHTDRLCQRFRIPIIQRDLLCVWYWTESGWQDFVRQYQSMPDIYEDYYFKYDPEPNDRFLLVSMSSKPKQGSAKKVQPSCVAVDKPVDNRGANGDEKVQVAAFSIGATK